MILSCTWPWSTCTRIFQIKDACIFPSTSDKIRWISDKFRQISQKSSVKGDVAVRWLDCCFCCICRQGHIYIHCIMYVYVQYIVIHNIFANVLSGFTSTFWVCQQCPFLVVEIPSFVLFLRIHFWLNSLFGEARFYAQICPNARFLLLKSTISDVQQSLKVPWRQTSGRIILSWDKIPPHQRGVQ